MTYRRRRTWAGTAIGSAVLAVVTLLAIQGCAPAAPADAQTSVAHVLTLPAAEDVYHHYVEASDAAAAAGDEALALMLVTAAQWAQVKAQYTALATTGTAVPRYRYGTPQFYLPALAGYPEWFVVEVPRQADAGGRLGAPVNTLLVFSRAAQDLSWTLGGSAVLGQPMPALARNRDGYAVAVSTDASSLLLRPDVAGATQAAVVDDGPASPAAAVVAGGSQTTGLYAAQAAYARSAASQGLQYTWLLQGAPFPEFGLRTADGGALVFYGMYLDTETEHPGLRAGAPIRVSPDLTALFAVPDEVGYHALWANWAYEYAAIDPPATAPDAKIGVIAWQGMPYYVHAA